MITRAFSVCFEGIEPQLVEIECAISPGLPAFSIIGLPDKAVSEARDRIRSALGALSIALLREWPDARALAIDVASDCVALTVGSVSPCTRQCNRVYVQQCGAYVLCKTNSYMLRRHASAARKCAVAWCDEPTECNARLCQRTGSPESCTSTRV